MSRKTLCYVSIFTVLVAKIGTLLPCKYGPDGYREEGCNITQFWFNVNFYASATKHLGLGLSVSP